MIRAKSFGEEAESPDGERWSTAERSDADRIFCCTDRHDECGAQIWRTQELERLPLISTSSLKLKAGEPRTGTSLQRRLQAQQTPAWNLISRRH